MNSSFQDTVIVIGNFDALHLGHQHLIKQAIALAKKHALASAVLTFDPLPHEFLHQQKNQINTQNNAIKFRLFSTHIRKKYMYDIGVDHVLIEKFDTYLRNLTPQAFVETILLQKYHCKICITGENFLFGKDRVGDTNILQQCCKKVGIECHTERLITNHDICATDTNEITISSTQIRQYIQNYDFSAAKKALGRAYFLSGHIVKGQQLGRTLGFPTANIQLDSPLNPPLRGVFAVTVDIVDAKKTDNQQALKGVLNIGYRPTVHSNNVQKFFEVHIFDFNADIYTQDIHIYLHTFIRDEQKFVDLEALKRQINLDIQIAKTHLTSI